MDGKIYLVERINEIGNCRYYAEHGPMGEVQDAIGYDNPEYAKKFRTEEEARRFIQTEIPEWGRETHRTVGLYFTDFDTADGLQLRTVLAYGIGIPDEMLEPKAGRLRIWRR